MIQLKSNGMFLFDSRLHTTYIDAMDPVSVKEEARKLIERLPDDVTWDDLMHQIYVRQSIERGLADSDAGKVTDVAEVRSKFGLSR